MNTKKILLILISIFTYGITAAQSSDDVLNLLIQKGLVNQSDADSVRADYAIKQQTIKEKQKTFDVISKSKLSIGGFADFRYRTLQEPAKKDGFDVRRVRLDIKGNLSSEWDFRLQTDFAISPKIIDAYFAYKPYDYFQVTGGQFKIPFGLEGPALPTILETIDRAQISDLTGRAKDAIGDQSGRDIGVQINGNLFKTQSNRFLLDYYLAYFNGQGINIAADKNEAKDIVARLVTHPYSFLDFGISYSNGYDNWGTPAKDQNHIRYAADLSVKYNDFTFSTEYIEAQEGTYVANGQTKDLIRNGWYAQAAYFFIPNKLQAVVKYDTFDKTKNDPKNDISTFYTAGANFIITKFARVQLNYKHKVEEGNNINKDEIVAQLEVKF
ncbi:MAG: porin [Flavobacterium sp.]|uniref:porin n=1 Tax=Flavobacterium sp. TaxID=239 RepID=UPI00262BA518|nr:porin [Flavobacterium sp.]MDD5150251.1 porin [Flavobacterium sp.]